MSHHEQDEDEGMKEFREIIRLDDLKREEEAKRKDSENAVFRAQPDCALYSPSDLDFKYTPEDLIPGIVKHVNGTKLSDEDQKMIAGKDFSLHPSERKELCRACGWNDRFEITSDYLPRLRILHAVYNRGLWVMGNDWMIWDRQQAQIGNDFMTHQFLQKQNPKHIPLVKSMTEFKDENGKFNFVVMSRAKGVPLHNIWQKLHPKNKRGYVDQMVEILRELRGFTAEFPQRVDGSPIRDDYVSPCPSMNHCKWVGKTKEEWLDSIDAELREGISRQLRTKDKAAIEAKLQELRHNFPEGAPYVLTHGDLNMGNIMVDQGKIVAIVDWEGAGYLPWWWEISTSYYRSLGDGDSSVEMFDMVWKELGLNIDGFRRHISRVRAAYMACPVTHAGRTHKWHRPPFCKCKPIGGDIWSHQWGDPEHKHVINYEKRLLNKTATEYVW